MGDGSKKIVGLFAFGMLVTAGLWFNSDGQGFTRNMAADINRGTGCVLTVDAQYSNPNDEWSAYSAISRLFRYSIDLFCVDPNVTMEDMLTQPAWLGIR